MKSEIISMRMIHCAQDRAEGGMGNIANLASSMARNGLINPITVSLIEDGSYEVVAGRRRFEAARSLDWLTIPASVYEIGEIAAEEVQLAENTIRLDMHPLDEALLYKKLLDNGETVQELSLLSGRSKSAIYQRIELLRLIPAMRELFRSGKLTLVQASMIGGIDSQGQEAFYKFIDIDEDTKEVYHWKFYSGIKQFGGVALTHPFSDCEHCTKRTHYSDNTLFPEITDIQDKCLDRECFNKQYVKMLIEKVRAFRSEHVCSTDSIEENVPVAIIERIPFLSSSEVDESYISVDGVEHEVLSFQKVAILDEEDIHTIYENGPFPGLFFDDEEFTFVLYVDEQDYWEMRKRADAKADAEEEEPIVPIQSPAELGAYREIMEDRILIQKKAKKIAINAAALRSFDNEVTPAVFKDMLNLFNSDIVAFVASCHTGISEEAVIEDTSWMAGKDIDWQRKFIFDLLITRTIHHLYLPMEGVGFPDEKEVLEGLGESLEGIQRDMRDLYQKDVLQRMKDAVGDRYMESVESATFSDGEEVAG